MGVQCQKETGAEVGSGQGGFYSRYLGREGEREPLCVIGRCGRAKNGVNGKLEICEEIPEGWSRNNEPQERMARGPRGPAHPTA
jgi:hypothetical protein